jgi:hypothetical protein
VATTIQDQTKIVRNIDPSTSNPSPLPSGERIKVRGSHEFFNFLLNDFYDSFHIIQDFAITEPQYLDSKLRQLFCPYLIFPFSIFIIMLSAIGLYSKIAFRRIKVQYISTNGKLSSEFYSNQLAVP